jgi:hypothetical protein
MPTTASSAAPGPLETPDDTIPDADFRFDATPGGTGGYIFNLKTTGLGTGTHHLAFLASFRCKTAEPTCARQIARYPLAGHMFILRQCSRGLESAVDA